MVTATSNANTAYTLRYPCRPLRSPQIVVDSLFPAVQNQPYSTTIVVAGGVANYSWALTTGSTLPAGLTLQASTLGIAAVSGTPTATGSTTFTIQVTDSYTPARTASHTFTLNVLPPAACLLSGQYMFRMAGFRGGGAATQVGSINIDAATGGITGVTDYKDGIRTTPAEALNPGSSCVNRTADSGTLTLYSASGELQYNFSTTIPGTVPGSITTANPNGVSDNIFHHAKLQLVNSGEDSASGELDRVETPIAIGTVPVGNFAFGFLGVDSAAVHFGTIGRFTADASGNLSAGEVDSNYAGYSPLLVGAPLTGALAPTGAFPAAIGSTAPPTGDGRGTATFTSGSQSFNLAYYMVNANRIYVIDIDPLPSSKTGPTTARLSGYISTQTGDVTASNTFDGVGFAGPAILDLWGAQGSLEPLSATSLGRIYNVNTATGASSGTFSAILDTVDQATNSGDVLYAAQPFTISGNGRGTFSLTDGGGNTRRFVYYLDGQGGITGPTGNPNYTNGYVIEPGSATGTAGVLEAQYTPADPAVGYTNGFNDYFVGGTQFAQAPGPISLYPLLTFADGSLSSTYATGTFAVDITTGRGFGLMTETGVVTSSAVMYVVSPYKLDVMRFTYRGLDGAIEWVTQQNPNGP